MITNCLTRLLVTRSLHPGSADQEGNTLAKYATEMWHLRNYVHILVELFQETSEGARLFHNDPLLHLLHSIHRQSFTTPPNIGQKKEIEKCKNCIEM